MMSTDALTRNNVTVKGKGKQRVIFAPGFGFDQKVWEAVSESFEDDFQVILFDYVGFGNSDLLAYTPKRYSSIYGYVEDLLAICNDMDLSDAIFVGHSVGGMIGMLASIQQPELFSNLVMIGPSPSFLNEAPEYNGGFDKEELDSLLNLLVKNYFEWTTTISETIMNGSEQTEMKMEIEDHFRKNHPNITYRFAEVCFFTDYREHLPNVSVPTYIIQSANDVFVPKEVTNYMKDKIPDCAVSYSTAIGHCPHISHPKEISHLIKSHLNTDGYM